MTPDVRAAAPGMRARNARLLSIASAVTCAAGGVCFLLPKVAWSLCWLLPWLGLLLAAAAHFLLWAAATLCAAGSLVCGILALGRGIRWPAAVLAADGLLLLAMAAVLASPLPEGVPAGLARAADRLADWFVSGAFP